MVRGLVAGLRSVVPARCCWTARRSGRCVTPVAAVSGQGDYDARGPAGSVGEGARHDGGFAGAASAAAGVDRRSGAALRLLPERDDDPGRGSALDDEESDGGSDPDGDERPSLPLWHLSAHPDGDQAGRRCDGEGREVTMTGLLHEKEFSRKIVPQGRRRDARRLQRRRRRRSAPRPRRRSRRPVRVERPVRPDRGRLVADHSRGQHRQPEDRQGRDGSGHADGAADDRGRRAQHGLRPDEDDHARHERDAEPGRERR